MLITFAIIQSALAPPMLDDRALAEVSSQKKITEQSVQVSGRQLFNFAEKLTLEGQLDQALVYLKPLEQDPNPDFRAEARARIARIYIAKNELRTATIWFQRLLDEKPDAAAVRVELAKLLNKLGDEGGAGRQLRRAAAAPGLPEDVARALGRINANIRSNAPFVGNVEIGVAPDSNINRATQSRQIDLFGLPFDLDDDGRATSGVGLTAGANGLYRKKISDNARLNLQLGGNGNFYQESQFNDLTGLASIGAEIFDKDRSISLPITIGRRWIGQRKLYDFIGFSVNTRFALNPKSQLQAFARVNHFDYARRSDLTGNLYSLGVAYERVISPTFSARLGVNANQNDARSRINDTQSFGGEIILSKDLGKFTLFGKASYSRTEGDIVYFPFSVVREDDFYEGEIGMIFRRFSVFGLSPLIRLRRSESHSNVTLFDYRRNRVEMAVTRTF